MLAKKVIFSRRKENCVHKHVSLRVPMCMSEVRGKEQKRGNRKQDKRPREGERERETDGFPCRRF